jgi:hypothetical protein
LARKNHAYQNIKEAPLFQDEKILLGLPLHCQKQRTLELVLAWKRSPLKSAPIIQQRRESLSAAHLKSRKVRFSLHALIYTSL